MAKEKISNIYIICEEVDGKEAFRVEVTRKQKQSLSQKKGWVPSYSDSNQEKFTCTSCESLCKKIKEVTGGCSK